METFSAAWLALREPADHSARSPALVALVSGVLSGTPDASTDVFDLGAGAGSNLRYLVPHLGTSQRWHLLDHDAALLQEGMARSRAWATRAGFDERPVSHGLALERGSLRVTVATQPCDLAHLDDAVFHGAGTSAPLVTAAALLDLTSPAWMEALAARCAAAGAVVLFALSYDGRIACSPTDPEDEAVRALVNRHQRTNKGFGLAAGPDAPTVAAGHLEAHGYVVQRAASDWHLEPDAPALQRALVEGWAQAAADMSPQTRPAILGWRDRRLTHIDAGRSRLVVGHEDLAGWPKGEPPT